MTEWKSEFVRSEGIVIKTIDIQNISGIRIGHDQNLEAATGCTVVICEDGAVAGVDVRGGSPGTRETDALNPVNQCQTIHAVLLAGGSAFGLDAAAGVMEYLEERKIGRDVLVTKVPIVCGAILFDLMCGDSKIRPDKGMGLRACIDSESPSARQGNVGAGTGALVGKTKGPQYAMKGGLGTYALQVGDLQVGAIIAVNCVGDVYDPGSGRILAGLLQEDRTSIGSSEAYLIDHYEVNKDFFNGSLKKLHLENGNTVIGVIVTNAALTKAEANKLASIAHNGIARTIRPAHSVYDGDTLFTMCTGKTAANFDVTGILAARAVEGAILNAVRQADTLCGFPSCSEINQRNKSAE